MNKTVALPAPALANMASEAQANLPAHVAPKPTEIVHPLDTWYISETYIGTAGVKDTFIFDLGFTPDFQQTASRFESDYIQGFESGLDKIVFVNVGPSEGILDEFAIVYGAYVDDDAAADSIAVTRVAFDYGPAYQDVITHRYIYTEDVLIVGSDIEMHSANPYA